MAQSGGTREGTSRSERKSRPRNAQTYTGRCHAAIVLHHDLDIELNIEYFAPIPQTMDKQLQQQVQQIQQLQKQVAAAPTAQQAPPQPQQPTPNVQQQTQEMEKLRKDLQSSNVERERFQSQLEMLVQELERSQVSVCIRGVLLGFYFL